MRIKMTQVVIVIPLLFVALSKGEVVRDSVQESGAVAKEQNDIQKQVRQTNKNAKSLLKLTTAGSKVAIARVKANCIRTVDATTKQDGYYQPGAMVIDSKLKRPVRDGAAICNSLGDTAVVTDGSIAGIARVSLQDKAEYDKLFKQGALSGKTVKRK